MKNLKTKIGIPLTALACLLTFSCNSKKPEMQEEPAQEYEQTTPPSPTAPITIPEPKQEPSPYEKCDFGKTIDLLTQFNNYTSTYVLSDGRILELSYGEDFWTPDTKLQCLKLKIAKQSGDNIEKLIIKDYQGDGLTDGDIIGYFSGTSLSLTKQESETTNFDFSRLSQGTQKKITEEYVSIIKDAPERLSREYEKELRSFEKDVLGILKK